MLDPGSCRVGGDPSITMFSTVQLTGWLSPILEDSSRNFLVLSVRKLIKMFELLRRWLSGSFTCKKCGKNNHLYAFGFGECICPECYEDEKQFLFFDNSYILNRLLNMLQKRSTGDKYPTEILMRPEANEINLFASLPMNTGGKLKPKRVNRYSTTNFLLGAIVMSITYLFARLYCISIILSFAFLLELTYVINAGDVKLREFDLMAMLYTLWGGLLPLCYLVFWTRL